MAKAKLIEGIDCEANVLNSADKILRVRFGEVFERRGAVLDSEDVEGVHAMRVAIRRLRSTMRAFAPVFKGKPLKKSNKQLKRIADALGATRDEDVTIIALEKARKKADDERIKREIGELTERCRNRRAALQIDLAESLTAASLEKINAEFYESLDKIRLRKKRRDDDFLKAGNEIIGESLREFVDLSAAIYRPFDDDALHELRIAVKRLRYAAELFAVCRAEEFEPLAAQMAELQDYLGEVHDASIWIENLSADLRSEDENEFRTANVWLLSKFVKKRTKNYRSALKLWNKWKEFQISDWKKVSSK